MFFSVSGVLVVDLGSLAVVCVLHEVAWGVLVTAGSPAVVEDTTGVKTLARWLSTYNWRWWCNG